MSSLKDTIEKIIPSFEVFTERKLRNVQTEVEGRFEVVCPVTDRKDELWLKIKLTPNGNGDFIEYVSFYKWLLSLATEPLGIEGSCDLIYSKIENICNPTLLEVVVETGYKVINQRAIRQSWHKYLNKR